MALTNLVVLSLLVGCALAFVPRQNDFQLFNSTAFGNLKPIALEHFLKLNKAEQEAIVNEYAVNLCAAINEFIKQSGVDPLLLQDAVLRFDWLIFSGEMSLKNGKLSGIGSLIPSGDVIVSYQYPVLKLKLPLSFSKLSLQYDYTIQLMGLGPKGILVGDVKGCKYTIEIGLDLTTLRTNLIGFKLDTLGKLSLDLQGGIIEGMLSFLINLLIPFIQPIIRLVLDGFLEPAVGGIIDQINNLVIQLLGEPGAQFMLL
ncbi:hypothetical protein FQR65_LT03670 [Abscondita terminalis]|nr:hypothetical protein FQR65_LT03670 [Abscondita terminalis]